MPSLIPNTSPGAFSRGTFVFSMNRPLGDFILTWPTLRGLRRRFRNLRFIGLGNPDQLELAKALGLVDEIHSIREPDLLPFYQGRSIPSCLGNLQGAVIWTHEPHRRLPELLRRQCGARFCVYPCFTREKSGHILEHHLGVLKSFGLPATLPEEPFFPMPAAKTGIALIHPGAGMKHKTLRPEFYGELGRELLNGGYRDVRIVLGPRERDLAAVFRDDFRMEIPGNCLALGRLIAGASLFVGNDSGPSHLAGMLGIPTMALYKRDTLARWGVRGRHARCVLAEADGLPAGALLAAIAES